MVVVAVVMAMAEEKDWRFEFFFSCCGLLVVVVAVEKDWRFSFFFLIFLFIPVMDWWWWWLWLWLWLWLMVEAFVVGFFG